MARKKLVTDETRQQRYEAAGKRPGTPIGTRVSDPVLAKLDARMKAEKKSSRSAWLLSLIHRELNVGEPNAAPKKKARGK